MSGQLQDTRLSVTPGQQKRAEAAFDRNPAVSGFREWWASRPISPPPTLQEAWRAGAVSERERLREGVKTLRQEEPRCDCGLPAVCFGSYEGQEPAFACDLCCAHGCGDGNCVTVWEHFAQKVLALMAEPGEPQD